jgi:hypothetical protein
MRLTHSYKNNSTLHDLGTMLRQSIVAFVDRNAETFNALVRSGNPFGANWLPKALTHHKSDVKSSATTDKELAHMQQQINRLTLTVTSLSNRVEQLSSQLASRNPAQSVVSINRPAEAPKNEIGINRYRALQQKP